MRFVYAIRKFEMRKGDVPRSYWVLSSPATFPFSLSLSLCVSITASFSLISFPSPHFSYDHLETFVDMQF
jgi:hypothetical protein